MPTESEYELLDQLSMVVAVHLVLVPGTNKFLYMERPSGYHPDNSREIAGTLDLTTNEWKHLQTPDGLFCCGHTLSQNGTVVIVGGHKQNAGFPSGLKSVRTFTPGDDELIKHTDMQWPRWYPSATLMPNGKIIIMGGTQGVGAGTARNPFYEVWSPDLPSVTIQHPVESNYLQRVKQQYYPFNYVMPDGTMFNWCSLNGWIMRPEQGEYLVELPSRPRSVTDPDQVITTQFPFTGTSVMLMLRPEDDYAFEAVQFGGAPINAVYDLNLTACREAARIRVTRNESGAFNETGGYDFHGGWQLEEMGQPRVMPDSVLLPNGRVVLLNGAARGVAGDAASGGGSRSSYPAFYSELYDPYQPAGARWTTLARSQIARLYHSTAVLTPDGDILVSGCDRCAGAKIETNLEFSSIRPKAEYRNEVFRSPYTMPSVQGLRPRILAVERSMLGFNEEFAVTYTGELDDSVVVTGAVLVAPGSATHSFNTNQRVVKLVVESHDVANRRLRLRTPPTINHFPPQMAMLFLLSGDMYSKSEWVTLVG